jgi:hypothetical protein
VLVVSSAEEPDAFRFVYRRTCESVDVVVLERTGGRASPARIVLEGALPAVASVHLALDRIGNVP